jgi:hypothetical protein
MSAFPVDPIVLPAEFHRGLTPQAKEELCVVLRVLSERIINRPDVQAWWRRGGIGSELFDRMIAARDETGSARNAVPPLMEKLRADNDSDDRNALRANPAYPLAAGIRRIMEVCEPIEPCEVLLWVLANRFAEEGAIDSAVDVINRLRTVQGLPVIDTANPAPLEISFSDIDEDEQSAILDATMTEFVSEWQSVEPLGALAKASWLQGMIERLQNTIAGSSARQAGGRTRRNSELKAEVFYRNRMEGETVYALGRELEAQAVVDGERTVRNYLKQIAALLTHEAEETV